MKFGPHDIPQIDEGLHGTLITKRLRTGRVFCPQCDCVVTITGRP